MVRGGPNPALSRSELMQAELVIAVLKRKGGYIYQPRGGVELVVAKAIETGFIADAMGLTRRMAGAGLIHRRVGSKTIFGISLPEKAEKLDAAMDKNPPKTVKPAKKQAAASVKSAGAENISRSIGRANAQKDAKRRPG